MAKVEKNLTEGSIVKQLVWFAIPFLLSNLVQTLYNVADMYIVGQYVGPAGISGVNIGGQVTFMMTTLVIGLSVGGTVVIAQHLGNGDRKAVQESISTMLIALIVAGIVLTVLMLILSDVILRLIQTPEESYADARSYLDITLLGTMFIFGYNALSAIMRGMGDSRRPMIFVCIACVLNIGLDYLLVGAAGMGAAGAAIATVFSQGVSMVLCIIYLKKHDFIFDFKLRSFRFHKDRFWTLMRVGVPMSIQNLASNLSFVFLTALANGLGLSASAALGVVGKFNGFAIMPGIAIGNSVSAVSAQNFGAGRIDRAKKTLYTGLVMTLICCVPIFLISRFFPAQIIGIFNKDPDMVQSGMAYMTFFTLDYLIAPLFFAVNGIVTGSGHTGFSSITGILSAIGFRIPMAYLFGILLDGGMRGLGVAGPVASFGSLVITGVYYLSGKWKNSTVVHRQAQSR